jgi:hypothetical protein
MDFYNLRFIGYWFITAIIYILFMKYVYYTMHINNDDIEKFLIISAYIWYMIMLLDTTDGETFMLSLDANDDYY